MGKKGEALRAAKLQNTRYTFTREQLEERDRTVEKAYKERYEDRLRAMFKAEQERVDAEIAAEWKRREEIFGDRGGNDSIFNLMALTIAVPIEVLIDEFDWRPLPPEEHKVHPRSRLARFVIRCEEILNAIAEDETKDIRTYCEEVWQKTGARLNLTEGAYGDETRK